MSGGKGKRERRKENNARSFKEIITREFSPESCYRTDTFADICSFPPTKKRNWGEKRQKMEGGGMAERPRQTL